MNSLKINAVQSVLHTLSIVRWTQVFSHPKALQTSDYKSLDNSSVLSALLKKCVLKVCEAIKGL